MSPKGCCLCKRRNQELKSIPHGYDGPKFEGNIIARLKNANKSQANKSQAKRKRKSKLN